MFKAEQVPLTSGHSHVGSHLESGVNVDDCAPHHIAGKVPWDKLHGSSQIISGLVALLCAVICVVRETPTFTTLFTEDFLYI